MSFDNDLCIIKDNIKQKGDFKMDLTFTKEAQQRLQKYLGGQNYRMILDFDDGVGPVSKLGNCSLDVNYKLIFVDQDEELPDFNAHFDSNLGPIYYKDFDAPQYDEHMTLDFNPRYFTLPLKSDYRMLTDNVEVMRVSHADLTTAQTGPAHDC